MSEEGSAAGPALGVGPGAEKSVEVAVLAAIEALRRAQGALSDGEIAAQCSRAVDGLAAGVEAMFDRAMERPRSKGASPALVFHLGYLHGGARALYDAMSDGAREGLVVPAADKDAAWAIVRSQLARGGFEVEEPK